MQISEVSVKVCFIGLPRQPIDARGPSRLKDATLSMSMLMWWRSAVNLSFFRCLATCRTRSSAWDTLSRSCGRCWLAFPLAPALGSTGSAAFAPALFVGSLATMAESDFSMIVHHRLRLLAFPMRTSGAA